MKTLNIAQKLIVLVALIIVVGMTVYPPWVVVSHPIDSGPYASSYGLIWLPPSHARFVDLYRLAIQYGAVMVVAGGLCLILRR